MKAIALLIILIASSFSANAQSDNVSVSILSTVTAAIGAAATNILPQAIMWLGALMTIQFFITNFALLKNGSDMEAVFGKLIGLIAWFGFCFYVLNNGPDFIDSVGTGVLQKFAPNMPTPGSIITATLVLCTSLLIAIGAVGTSVVGVGNSSLAMVLVYALFFIFSIGMYMAIKVFMLALELALVVLLSPLSFSFLGLNALKDQGIAPFKSLISLIYRIILLGIIFTAFSKVIGVSSTALNGINWSNPLKYGEALNIIFSTLTAFPLLAYLVYKSDAIASSLAGGSTNMGPGDVAGAAAAGAAAGAAIASGGAGAAGVAGAASKIPQSMANFMSTLSGGGSLSNASSRGAGGASAAMPPPPVSSSLSGPPSGAAAPKFETNKAGAPVRPAAISPAPASNPPAGDSMPPERSSSTAEGAALASASDVEKSANSASDTGSTGSAVSSSPTSNPSSEEAVPMFQTNKSGAPVRPAAAPTGSGASASIGGASTLDETANRLNDFMKQQAAPKRPTTREALGNANHHVAQEKASTSVSINVNASD